MPRIQERADLARSVFEQRYAEYQYKFVEFLVAHLTDLSREFRGDLQTPLILAIIGQVFIQAMTKGRGNPADTDSGNDDHSVAAAGISASRIADVTGISRETVRRKLTALAHRGWIEQSPDRQWRLRGDRQSSDALRDLAEIDRRGIERVALLFSELENLVGSKS